MTTHTIKIADFKKADQNFEALRRALGGRGLHLEQWEENRFQVRNDHDVTTTIALVPKFMMGIYTDDRSYQGAGFLGRVDFVAVDQGEIGKIADWIEDQGIPSWASPDSRFD